MFNSVFFLQIKHILTKKNFQMFFKAGKLVFHVENRKIQSMLRFSGCFHVELRVICLLKTNFFHDFYEIIIVLKIVTNQQQSDHLLLNDYKEMLIQLISDT